MFPTLSLVALVLTLVALAILYKHRNDRLLRASSLSFTMLMLVGAAMLAVHPLTGAAYPVRGFQRLLLICLRCL